LSEREQACDELVLGMRIDPGVYASGIVKVTRFCVNGKLAGASCVTGSNMKRRLEMILKTKVLARFTVWHWMLIGATACGLLALSLLIDYRAETLPATLTNPTSFSPQHTIGFWPEETSEATAEKLQSTSEVSMNIDNRPGCPLMIVNASMRWLEVVEPSDGTSFAVVFRFELSNTTNRQVKRFVTSPFLPERDKLPSEGKIVMISRQVIEPLNKVEIPMLSRPLRLTVRPESLTIRVEGVDFEDGSTWGNTGKSPSRLGPAPTKVRVGGAVQSANLISYVAPVYPPLAKEARLQGDVVLEVEIAREGDVTNLKVVSGHALLLDAALAAARQWKYKPTLLNGQPVEVVSQITVPFRLAPESP